MRKKIFITALLILVLMSSTLTATAAARTVKIGLLSDCAPYSSLENDEITGIAAVVVDAIGAASSDSLSFSYYDNYGGMIADMQMGNIDAAFPVSDGESFAKENGMKLSDKIASASVTIVYGAGFDSGNIQSVSASANGITLGYARLYFPNATVDFCDTDEQAINSVANEMSSCAVIQTENVAAAKKVKGASKLTFVPSPRAAELKIAVQSGDSKTLGIMNKAAGSIDVSNMMDKMGSGASSGKAGIAGLPMPLIGAGAAGLVVSLLLGFLLGRKGRKNKAESVDSKKADRKNSEKVVEKIVEVPVEKIVEVPVEKIVEVPVKADGSRDNADGIKLKALKQKYLEEAAAHRETLKNLDLQHKQEIDQHNNELAACEIKRQEEYSLHKRMIKALEEKLSKSELYSKNLEQKVKDSEDTETALREQLEQMVNNVKMAHGRAASAEAAVRNAEAKAAEQVASAAKAAAAASAASVASAGYGNAASASNEQTDIRKVVSRALGSVQSQASKYGLELKATPGNISDFKVYANESDLENVIRMLLKGAVKHSDRCETVIFRGSQGAVGDGSVSEYGFVAAYTGSGMSFDGELVAKLGGIVDVEISDGGETVISLSFKFRICR